MCESVICRTCNGYVFEENAIFCDVCSTWYHLKCTKLNRKSLNFFSVDDLPWYCDLCVQLPFSSMSDDALKNYVSFNSFQFSSLKGSCLYCKKIINDSDKFLKCQLSKHYVHRSCENLVNQNITTETQIWSCSNCYEFPFGALDHEDFYELFEDDMNYPDFKNCKLPIFDIPKIFANSINEFISDDDNEMSDICKYYSTDIYNELQDKKNNFLSVFHTNIRSLNKNFEGLETFLSNLDTKFDVISLSETWAAKRPKFSKKLCGYHPFEEIAGYTQNSGCGIYIRENIKYKLRTDLNLKFKNDDEEFQSLWVEIINKKKKNLLISVTYRHPKSKNNNFFTSHLKERIRIASLEKKELIITGDFNIDFLKYDQNPKISEFIDMTLQNYLKPYILIPTYFKRNSASLIDNILYNGISNNCISGNFDCPIGDHLPNFLIIENLKIDKKLLKSRFRDMKNFDENLFLNDFQSKDLLNLIKCSDDTNKKTETVFNTLNTLFEKHAPIKTLSNKELKQKQKPWITKRILDLISKKKSLYGIFMQKRDKETYRLYKLFRNKIKNEIEKSRKDYYQKYFSECGHNSKRVWDGINGLLAGKKTLDPISCIRNGSEIETETLKISNTLNNYFGSIAKNLAEKLDKKETPHFSSYLGDEKTQEHFNIGKVTPTEVKKEIDALSPKKADDVYFMNIKLIKILSKDLSPVLSELFNNSFEKGIFPDLLKLAKVTPQFKGGDKMEPGNFRPVSVLPIFDKILEKLMKKRLMEFLNDKKILNDVQFGFRANKSTSMAVLSILQKIYAALEEKKIPCCIFLDFAKAFDTVDHKILLSKLSHYGIKGKPLQWFSSYLKGRHQVVKIGSIFSDKTLMEYGVPQGSVLGPILFLIFINDISMCTSKGEPTLFADDSSLLYSNSSIEQLENDINSDLIKISDWLIANKLTLNVDKSNYIVFKQVNDCKLDINLNGTPLLQKEFVKYLGLLIDSKLSWNHHIDYLKKKLNSGISIIYKLRRFLNEKQLKDIYFAFIHSNILYGLEVWGAADKSKLSSVSNLLDKSLRALYFKNKGDELKPLYNENKLLTLENMINLSWCTMINKCVLGFHSTDFKDNVFASLTHTKDTRNKAYNLNAPRYTLRTSKNSIFCNGINFWNQNSIGKFKSEPLQFKNKVKDYLLKRQIEC